MEDRDTQAVATLIGDLVASKRAKDRQALQGVVESVLAEINVAFHPPQRLRATLGDEFQGAFATVGEATRASLLIRLSLLERGSIDSRYGLGFGVIATLRDSPEIEEGGGWWSARAAIELAKDRASSPRTSFVRTAFHDWKWASSDAGLPEAPAVNAFLLCRDALVSQMSPRSRRNLHGLLLECPQSELAERERVTQSAISQDLSRSGAFAVDAAQRSLEV
ncbi:MAG TPA: SatD family protein [Solirubrobacterales bacterium]|nr:SatD family protein [Solirubrobacterales bacterium]